MKRPALAGWSAPVAILSSILIFLSPTRPLYIAMPTGLSEISEPMERGRRLPADKR
jgi:hypothetical protein